MYITLLFRGGLVLLAVWALMWLALVRTGWQRRRSADVGQRAAARALVVVLGVLLVMQFIQPYLTYGGVSHVVWLLAAVVAVPAKLAASR
jgi:O-antigen ligase